MKKAYISPVSELIVAEPCNVIMTSINVGGNDKEIDDSGEIRVREYLGDDDAWKLD